MNSSTSTQNPTIDDTQVADNAAHKAYLIWGRMAHSSQSVRRAMLVFVLASIISLSFCQLGFWSIGAIDEKPVYLMLVLGPLAMGALLFGPVTGTLLGLFAGAVVFMHATFFPLDYYEVYFMTALNTFGLFTILGALASWLFARGLRSIPHGVSRTVRIILICTILSAVASLLVIVNILIEYGASSNQTYIREVLIVSPLGFFLQAIIDAALTSILCLIIDAIFRRLSEQNEDKPLTQVFFTWMTLTATIVFMLTSAIVFSVATKQADAAAEVTMLGEVSYLQTQLDADAGVDCDQVLEGYDPETDGTVVITDKNGTVLASDMPDRYPKGSSFLTPLGSGLAEGEDISIFDVVIEGGGIASIETFDENGVATLQFATLAVSSYNDGYAFVLREADLIYNTRFSTMVAMTALAIALILSIVLIATALLKQVVVLRIDETNGSLNKITHGDLNERVRVNDSREFLSLSTGINTTVAALKDSITEAEQKNAQELATAKAIQESALPREFPPFPDIKYFDIYASMKTAKEVGGDFYDFFLIDEGKLGFLLADVAGKGIPAALFMMTARTQIRNYMEADLPIDEAVSAANHQLCLGNDANMFVTLFACVLDYHTGELTYTNAGHNPPLLMHDSTWTWLRTVSGLPLGLYDGLSYKKHTLQLERGDVLYMYTDGVTEAMDANEDLFGEKRLEETLYRYITMNPRSISVGIRRAITDFTLDAEQSDDITMLCMKYGMPPERKAVMILNATVDQLIHVHNFIHEELHRRSAPRSVRNPLDIAAEELFVNVCHYAYPNATPENPGEVRISFEYEANPPSLTVEIEDDGVPYNPLAKPDAVTPDDIMDVPIGGLGILMAKQSVDDMQYRREHDSNILTFRKGW